VTTFFKSSIVLFLLLLYTLAALLLIVLPAGRAGRRSLRAGNAALFARLILRALGIRVRYRKQGHRPLPAGSCLVVANHVSYVDILVIAALRPSVFVTSVELKHSFPLGMLARLGGSLFVERRNPAGLKREIRDIGSVLQEGQSVVLFPEGTTSDGATVRPFRNSLFTAAILSRRPVLPLCLRYLRVNGRRVDEKVRDSVYYYGHTTFLEHVPRLLRLRSLHVECIALDPVPSDNERSRKDLAARCRDSIVAAYHAKR
jgi:1-acyl-sn-glycerol-3-phosphate acyltransferase